MSNEIAHLLLRLEGPLQSWGHSSRFNRRRTALFPSKSAVLGMCCAAMGIPRGSDSEAAILAKMRALGFLAVSIPRSDPGNGKSNRALPVRRMVDYHTVENTRTAEGKIKKTHLTWRHYLCDAAFAVVLSGERALIEEIGRALSDPVWGLWLGRKACIPAAPVCGGLFEDEEAALRSFLEEKPLRAFSHQREVKSFDEGTDTLPDQPLCFGGTGRAREYAPRRLCLTEGME